MIRQKVLVDCSACGYPFFKEKHAAKRNPVHACSKECVAVLRKRPRNQITKPCTICGTLITRRASGMLENSCCSAKCSKLFRQRNMLVVNEKYTPRTHTPESKRKLRNNRLGKGEGKSYEKTYGRHTHRIVAEEILGRPLRKGEVVHHKDEIKRNNDPSNIQVFPSQSEHARHHALKKPINSRKL